MLEGSAGRRPRDSFLSHKQFGSHPLVAWQGRGWVRQKGWMEDPSAGKDICHPSLCLSLGCSPMPHSSVPLGLATTYLTTPLLFLGVGGLGGLGPLGLQPGEH